MNQAVYWVAVILYVFDVTVATVVEDVSVIEPSAASLLSRMAPLAESLRPQILYWVASSQ